MEAQPRTQPQTQIRNANHEQDVCGYKDGIKDMNAKKDKDNNKENNKNQNQNKCCKNNMITNFYKAFAALGILFSFGVVKADADE